MATSNYDRTRCPRKQQVDTGRKMRSFQQPLGKSQACVSSKRGPGGPACPTLASLLPSCPSNNPRLLVSTSGWWPLQFPETPFLHPISDPSSHSNIPSSTSPLGTPIALSGQWVYLFANLLTAHLLHPITDGTVSPTNIHTSPTAGPLIGTFSGIRIFMNVIR